MTRLLVSILGAVNGLAAILIVFASVSWSLRPGRRPKCMRAAGLRRQLPQRRRSGEYPPCRKPELSPGP
jgi:hypothetical protein